MALMLLQQPNFLVLDEPTNNLDIQSAEILEEVLLGFAGATLMVSHNTSWTAWQTGSWSCRMAP